MEAELARLNKRTRQFTSASNKTWGDRPFSRGHLYKILSNPIYAGKIAHKGEAFDGQHEAIIAEDKNAAETFLNYYQARAAAGDAAAKEALRQLQQNFKVPGALPYLDVWFKDADEGFAVGSFGMLIATTDGGRTWSLMAKSRISISPSQNPGTESPKRPTALAR